MSDRSLQINVFKELFRDSLKLATHLSNSLKSLKNIFPIDEQKFKTINEEELEKIDAFRVRFTDLQDMIGNKLFKSVLLLELENIGSMLDIINNIDKRKIISSFEEWQNLRDIRNFFSHEYPESDDEKAENLNMAYKHSTELFQTLQNINIYVSETINIPMDEFQVTKL